MEPVVEIFKTTVFEQYQADDLLKILTQRFPEHKINFDLEDCDKILRIEGRIIDGKKVSEVLMECGYSCEIFNA